MRMIDLAVVMIILNGAMAITNEINLFGMTPYNPDITTREEFESAYPVLPEGTSPTGTSSEAFLYEALSSTEKEDTGLWARIKNVALFGSLIDQSLSSTTGLHIPQAMKDLFDAINGFLYVLTGLQLFLRFNAER